MPTNFSIYDNHKQAEESIPMYSYQTGDFLSLFSGSLISVVSASTIKDAGVEKEVTVMEFNFPMTAYTLTINGTSYQTRFSDFSYEVVIEDFHLSLLMSEYLGATPASGSTLGEMSPFTLEELSVTYVA